MKNPLQGFCDAQNRRQFIANAGIGLGAAALSGLASPASAFPLRAMSHAPFPI